MWFDFKKLLVWEKSMDLTEKIYKLLIDFPKDEIFWLVSQIKRCSVSIPSNIAEWNDRNSQKEFKRFLFISKWTCAELETQLILAFKLWYIDKSDYDKFIFDIIEIRKMLSSLISKL